MPKGDRMNENDLDRVLSEREEIVPSSGFTASVMDAVQQEAAMPAPIPFPWKWALPGLVVCILLVVGLIARWVQSAGHAEYSVAATRPMERFLSALPHGLMGASALVAVEWSALALLVSLLAVWCSMRIAFAKE